MLYFFNKKTSDKLVNPYSICIDRAGFVYVSEYGKTDPGVHCISVFTKEGNFVTSFGSHGKNLGQFNYPCGLACDRNGILYVCDCNNNCLQIF